jgi:hypothetical protein
MALDTRNQLTSESMHLLLGKEVVETGKDIFKPINSNPTDSRIQNPFAVERAQYVKQLREQEERSKVQR